MPPQAFLESVNPPFLDSRIEEDSEKPCPTKEPSMDDYKLIKPLGHGNMGTVFLALHRETSKLLALKVMTKEVLVKRDSVERAETEKQILSSLDHPFLPFLHCHFETKKHKVLVLDYCSGGDLNVLRHKQPEKKFSEAAARFYGAEVVLALEHLHKLGFVYRDLKPENILVHSSGHIMLTDFDLCLRMAPYKQSHRAMEKESKKPNQVTSMFSCLGSGPYSNGARSQGRTRPSKEQKRKPSQNSKARVTPLETKYGKKGGSTGRSHSFVGTEEYVAPEVLWGTGHDYAVDWWTLGILLYELVYGVTPFKSFVRKETFFNILCREPKFAGPWTPLQDLIRKLLAKEPDQRLGFNGGAEEIKSHMFFRGLKWDALQYVSRPPYVPESPVSLDEIVGLRGSSEDLNLEEYLDVVELARAEKSRSRSSKRQDPSDDNSIGSSQEDGSSISSDSAEKKLASMKGGDQSSDVQTSRIEERTKVHNNEDHHADFEVF